MKTLFKYKRPKTLTPKNLKRVQGLLWDRYQAHLHLLGGCWNRAETKADRDMYIQMMDTVREDYHAEADLLDAEVAA